MPYEEEEDDEQEQDSSNEQTDAECSSNSYPNYYGGGYTYYQPEVHSTEFQNNHSQTSVGGTTSQEDYDQCNELIPTPPTNPVSNQQERASLSIRSSPHPQHQQQQQQEEELKQVCVHRLISVL